MEWYWIVLISIGAAVFAVAAFIYWLFKDWGNGFMGK